MLPVNTWLDNRYRIIQELGGGGQGTVYLAEDSRLGTQPCAVKELSPNQLQPQDLGWAIPAFKQEAEMLARLNHPGLVRVSNYFSERGNWYLVMDYVPGQTLEQIVGQAPRGVPIDVSVNYTLQICNVLEYLHSQQPAVIFRDLKPGNIMVTPSGEIKLIDFGIARFFRPGQTRNTVNLGTPGYASPEHGSLSGGTDVRSDIYSLGVVLHQLLTGHDPAAAPFNLPPVRSLNSNIPPALETVIQKAIQLRPADRFQTAAEFKQALLSGIPVMGGRSKTQVMPGNSPTGAGPTRPRSNKVWLLLAGLLAAVVAGVFFVRQSALPPETPQPVSQPRPASAAPSAVVAPTSSPQPSLPTHSAPPPTSTLSKNTPPGQVRDPAPARMFKFMSCAEPCADSSSNATRTFPEGITRLYAQ